MDLLLAVMEQQERTQQDTPMDSPPHSPHVDLTDSPPDQPPLKRCKHEHISERQKNLHAQKLMLSLREQYTKKRQCTSNQHQSEVVDVDSCNVSDPPPKQPWIESEQFTLYSCDKSIIESGKRLTDEVIDAGQKILATQFKEKFGKAGFRVLFLAIHSHLMWSQKNLFKYCITVTITG